MDVLGIIWMHIRVMLILHLPCLWDAYDLKSTILHFYGTGDAYATFDPWHICENSQLSFQFKTSVADGLILYQDDGGLYDFIEISLVQGQLKMRLKFAEDHLFKFIAGKHLNNKKWHTVTILRHYQTTTLLVDDQYDKEIGTQIDMVFGVFHRNLSPLFFGGIPTEYKQDLDRLSIPTVYFSKRYEGDIRNVMYTNCTTPDVVPKLQASTGVTMNQARDSCSDSNHCMNDGWCYVTENGVVCDCEHTHFIGRYCQIEAEPDVATFSGSEWLSYNFTKTEHADAITYNHEKVKISFKTAASNGLLFYTGDGTYYMNVGLASGQIYVSIYLGSSDGVNTKYVGGSTNFDDNLWHDLYIERNAQTRTCSINVSVDGLYSASWTEDGDFSDFTSRLMFLGGSVNTRELHGSQVISNFFGCMKNVVYMADTLQLRLIELGKSRQPIIDVNGQIKYDECADVTLVEPITMIQSQDFIILPGINDTTESFVSFTFNTNVKDGLVMYSSNPRGDLFAIEIIDGYCYISISKSGRYEKMKLIDLPLADGGSHTITVTFRAWGTGIMVKFYSEKINGLPKTLNFDTRGEPLGISRQPVYLGGLDYTNDNLYIHPAVYTATLRHGFIGCLTDVKIDGALQNLVELARSQSQTDIRSQCLRAESDCSNEMCEGGGRCHTSWLKDQCDCSATFYGGQYCNRDAQIMRFAVDQHLTVNLQSVQQSESDEFNLRFKTRNLYGNLLITQSKSLNTYLRLILEGGRLLVVYRFTDSAQTIGIADHVSDGLWHTVNIKRYVNAISVTYDEQHLTRPLDGGNFTMFYNQIRLGSVFTEAERFITLAMEEEAMLGMAGITSLSFIGHMQHFIFNGVAYEEITKRVGTNRARHLSLTASLSHEPIYSLNIVSVEMPEDKVMISTLQTAPSLNLYFKFRTKDRNGLLIYNSGQRGDILAIELVFGQLHLYCRVDGHIQELDSRMNPKLSDENWHHVSIVRNKDGELYMLVDEIPYLNKQLSAMDTELRLTESAYIGGIEPGEYLNLPDKVKSPYGFTGCLGSIELNGRRLNLLDISDSPFTPGCSDTGGKCTAMSCSNYGECIEDWTSIVCNCNMTSFTGPTCNQPGASFMFGDHTLSESIDMIVFNPINHNDTRTDNIAFGIQTKQYSGTLLKITSGNSRDFIHMKLVEGRIHVTYDIGAGEVAIGSLTIVNDYRYHVVRFTRNGYNATIQINQEGIIKRDPQAEKLTVFNSVSQILVGGLNAGERDNNPFIGEITGLTYNGIPVLELAKRGDRQIKIIEKVQHETTEETNPMLNSNSSSYHLLRTQETSPDDEDSNDLIIEDGSGDSGCLSVDCADKMDKSLDPDGEIFVVRSTSAPTTASPVTIIPLRTLKLASTTLNSQPVTTHNQSTVAATKARERPSLSTIATEINGNAILEFDDPNQTPNGLIDIERNIPLIAGICGAALFTIILIAIIACRLTRNKGAEESKNSNGQAVQSGYITTNGVTSNPHLKNDSKNLDDMTSTSSVTNGHRKPPTKEWYV